jgi:hypothetical protein
MVFFSHSRITCLISRQSISGSFNPIDEGEWSEQAYIGENSRFMNAISSGDRDMVLQMLRDGTDPNRRDHVGRAPLHVAILCQAETIACDLIDSGSRLTARVRICTSCALPMTEVPVAGRWPNCATPRRSIWSGKCCP